MVYEEVISSGRLPGGYARFRDGLAYLAGEACVESLAGFEIVH